MNQVAAKVVPALAAGCTMVLKPSEYSPFSAVLWAKVMHEAGVPAGVFNLINGDGRSVGAPLSSHPGIDMVSFTGSTRAGTEVAKNAAASVKRVHQELGGKSPNILLEDADFERAVTKSVQARVPELRAVLQCADAHAGARRETRRGRGASRSASPRRSIVGDPASEKTTIGPVVSKMQFERVESYIEKGIAEGAKLVGGGSGRPGGLSKGYFVKPTIFSNVNNQMTIAREEIFGPVLCILPYQSEEQAIQIANDTPVRPRRLRLVEGQRRTLARVGNRIRAGQVALNGASGDMQDPVRRLQDVRQRPRIRRTRPARLPRGQGGDRRRRCVRSAALG